MGAQLAFTGEEPLRGDVAIGEKCFSCLGAPALGEGHHVAVDCAVLDRTEAALVAGFGGGRVSCVVLILSIHYVAVGANVVTGAKRIDRTQYQVLEGVRKRHAASFVRVARATALHPTDRCDVYIL